MNATCLYQIELRGQIAENDINPLSPYSLTLHQVEVGALPPAMVTQLRVRTDQAGIIGLLRYLHGKGFVVLSLSRAE